MNSQMMKELHEALLDAFRSEDDLERMVYFGLGQWLKQIVDGGDLSDITFELLKWADGHGQIDKLAQAACQSNPGNFTLAAWRQKICKSL